MKIKIYADGANKKDILYFNRQINISGLTTNPSLMRKSGVKNYKNFSIEILKKVNKKPISFEVFADDFNNMYLQSQIISSWANNVYVKIPITNTKGISSKGLINKLSNEKIKLNITAIFTKSQVDTVFKSLNKKTPAIVSIFAGRIADTGRDPSNIIKYASRLFKKNLKHKILWASTREVLNIIQAEKAGADIITVPTSILNKKKLFNKSLNKYSLETVKEFYKDAKEAKYKI
tara:strand:+ start:4449 stop:5147 length:699 start_codon:yes stop_codon:yes gene_type:complete